MGLSLGVRYLLEELNSGVLYIGNIVRVGFGMSYGVPGEDPGSFRVEAEALDTGGLALELSEHVEVGRGRVSCRLSLPSPA